MRLLFQSGDYLRVASVRRNTVCGMPGFHYKGYVDQKPVVHTVACTCDGDTSKPLYVYTIWPTGLRKAFPLLLHMSTVLNWQR